MFEDYHDDDIRQIASEFAHHAILWHDDIPALKRVISRYSAWLSFLKPEHMLSADDAFRHELATR